jgi:hypothetical protein
MVFSPLDVKFTALSVLEKFGMLEAHYRKTPSVST